MHPLLGHLSRLGRTLLDLVLPAECVLCSSSEDDLCRSCFAEASGPPHIEPFEDMLLVTSGARAELVVRILRQLKDHGQTRLARPLSQWLQHALDLALTEAGLRPDDAVLVVPPSPWSSWRARGFRPVPLILSRARMEPLRLLANARRRRDQRSLGARDRIDNLAGAFRARFRLEGISVIIVDDVVTTGSTILEAARALEAAGARVVGAVTLVRVPLINNTEH